MQHNMKSMKLVSICLVVFEIAMTSSRAGEALVKWRSSWEELQKLRENKPFSAEYTITLEQDPAFQKIVFEGVPQILEQLRLHREKSHSTEYIRYSVRGNDFSWSHVATSGAAEREEVLAGNAVSSTIGKSRSWHYANEGNLTNYQSRNPKLNMDVLEAKQGRRLPDASTPFGLVARTLQPILKDMNQGGSETEVTTRASSYHITLVRVSRFTLPEQILESSLDGRIQVDAKVVYGFLGSDASKLPFPVSYSVVKKVRVGEEFKPFYSVQLKVTGLVDNPAEVERFLDVEKSPMMTGPEVLRLKTLGTR
jgi:hypothetical protein